MFRGTTEPSTGVAPWTISPYKDIILNMCKTICLIISEVAAHACPSHRWWFHRTSRRPLRLRCLLPSGRWRPSPSSPGWCRRWGSGPQDLRLCPEGQRDRWTWGAERQRTKGSRGRRVEGRQRLRHTCVQALCYRDALSSVWTNT